MTIQCRSDPRHIHTLIDRQLLHVDRHKLPERHPEHQRPSFLDQPVHHLESVALIATAPTDLPPEWFTASVNTIVATQSFQGFTLRHFPCTPKFPYRRNLTYMFTPRAYRSI